MSESIRTFPDRMLGCWKRKNIRFKNGETDTSTTVIWLQTLSSMVDMRIPERILDFSDGLSLEDYTPYPTASWESNDDDAYFQTVVNDPEDGWFDWKEDDSCMIESALSGGL